MLFPTLTFAVFFTVVFTGNWLLRQSPVMWRVGMLGASLVFYGWWDAGFVLLILVSIVGNWLIGQMVWRSLAPDGSTHASRLAVGVGVAANLALLGWFKYYGFFATSVVNAFADIGVDISPPLVEVTLPVGISFFTFQAMSYVIDLGRGTIRPMTLLDFGVYLSFFPQLVAGPIVRASEFAPQLETIPDPRYVNSAEGFRLILSGLFKKVVVSSYLASEIVDPVFAVPEQHSALEVLVAVYGYAIQIYADFSGYTDIAIGCALLLGFRFPQNFNSPYRSLSLQEFWRRWHMTLSRWLRDYLYIGLGGNRLGLRRTYVNLAIVMLLGGLWHGAAWTFVIWGAIHGVWLAAERFMDRERGFRLDRVNPVLGWLVTFHIVCLGWVFFRAESFDAAMSMLSRLGSWEEAPLVTAGVVATIGAMLALQFLPAAAPMAVTRWLGERRWATQGAILGVGLVLIDVLGPEGVAPFIYFQF